MKLLQSSNYVTKRQSLKVSTQAVSSNAKQQQGESGSGSAAAGGKRQQQDASDRTGQAAAVEVASGMGRKRQAV